MEGSAPTNDLRLWICSFPRGRPAARPASLLNRTGKIRIFKQTLRKSPLAANQNLSENLYAENLHITIGLADTDRLSAADYEAWAPFFLIDNPATPTL